MGWGGCKFGWLSVTLGEDLFVSALQIFEGRMDDLQQELRKLVFVCTEEDEISGRGGLQRAMGKSNMPEDSDEVRLYKVQP